MQLLIVLFDMWCIFTDDMQKQQAPQEKKEVKELEVHTCSSHEVISVVKTTTAEQAKFRVRIACPGQIWDFFFDNKNDMENIKKLMTTLQEDSWWMTCQQHTQVWKNIL
jgi:hypothetical protein